MKPLLQRRFIKAHLWLLPQRQEISGYNTCDLKTAICGGVCYYDNPPLFAEVAAATS